MQIILFHAFPKKVNSTKRPNDSSGETVDVYLKGNTSKAKPTFVIDKNNLTGAITTVNYIKAWSNYYYVDDIIFMTTKDHYELQCHEDVLASHKDEIGNATFLIERASFVYDNTLNDPYVAAGQMLYLDNQASTQIPIFGSSAVGTVFESYILRMVGNEENGVTTWVINSIDDIRPIFNNSIYEQPYTEGSQLSQAWHALLNYLIKAFFNPEDYVIDLARSPIPYNIMTNDDYCTTDSDDIYAKYYNTGIYATYISEQHRYISDMIRLNLPNFHYSGFRRYNPSYTRYTIYLPGIGVMPLSSEYLASPIGFKYAIDFDTGDIIYRLFNIGVDSTQETALIASYSGNIYAKIPIASTKSDIKQILGSSITTASAAMAGNVAASSMALADVVTNIATPQPSINGTQSSQIGIASGRDIIISQMVYTSGDIHLATMGRPLYQAHKINTLSGFIKCANASIDGIGDLGGAAAEINSYLNGGFYYE